MCDVGLAQNELSGIAGLVDDLVVATVNNRIYSRGHPRVVGTVADVLRRIGELFSEPTLQSVALNVVNGYLVHDGRPLIGSTLSAPKLIHPLERVASGGIEFERGVEEHEVLALLGFLGEVKASTDSREEANRALEAQGCRRIRLLPEISPEVAPELERAEEGPRRAKAGRTELPIELYQNVIETLQGMSVAICRGDGFALDETQAQVEQILRYLDEDREVMLNMSRYEQYDGFTFGHSIRVCILALDFVRHLTEDRELQTRVGTASLLHDIGKARVPWEILHAPGRLSADERREMELHATHGAEILLELDRSDPMAVAAAFGHHRTIDGGGYPQGVGQSPLSAVTRVVKICDVFEALTAVRPYKPAMEPLRAYAIMLSMTNHFDPALLKRFIHAQGIYPTGTTVRLTDDRLARVVAQTRNPARPRVRVESTPEGEPLHAEDETELDLSCGGVEITEGPLEMLTAGS